MQKTLLQRATALLTAAALTTTAAFAQAPTFEWGKKIGSTSSDYASYITTDMAGNSYTVGTFEGVVDFDVSANTFELDAANGATFITKLAPNGDFIWAKQSAFAISALKYANGHLYLSGYFYTTADMTFDSTTSNITSAGGSDVYVSKFDTAATLVWTKTIGNANNDGIYSFEVQSDGSFYLSSSFLGTLDTDPSAATNNITTVGTLPGDIENQISYFNANGDFVWAKQLTRKLFASDLVYHADALYVVGSLSDTITLPGGITLTPSNDAEFFMLKLNTTNQTIAWAKNVGAYDAWSINVYMNNNNPVLAATHSFGAMTVDYDPSAGTANITHIGDEAIFVEFDANGNFVRVNSLVGSNSSINAIETDYQGNIYALGRFSGTVDFNVGAGTNNITAVGNTSNTFVLKLNSANDLQFVETSDSGSINSTYLHLDNTGNIYVAGNFQNTCDLDFTAGTSYATSTGLYDAFVFKLDQPTFVSVSRQAENTTPIRLFPNPAANFINIENAPIGSQLRIVDALGRTALSQIISSEYSQIATDALSNGVYFFQFHINGEATATQKIIIAK